MTETPDDDPRARNRPADAVEVGRRAWIAPGDLRWKFTRSGGPGGQHVNTASTRVECRVALDAIGGVHPEAVARLRLRAGHLLVAGADELRIVSQEHRSQARNRGACLDRLRSIIEACEAPPKVRRKTRPTRGSVERRLKDKKQRSERKRDRGWRGDD